MKILAYVTMKGNGIIEITGDEVVLTDPMGNWWNMLDEGNIISAIPRENIEKVDYEFIADDTGEGEVRH